MIHCQITHYRIGKRRQVIGSSDSNRGNPLNRVAVAAFCFSVKLIESRGIRAA